jgi:hypothetical protein
MSCDLQKSAAPPHREHGDGGAGACHPRNRMRRARKRLARLSRQLLTTCRRGPSPAVRRWYRGDCGENERRQPHDYNWRPARAELRKIAPVEKWRVQQRTQTLRKLIAAEPLIEFRDGALRTDASPPGGCDPKGRVGD